MRSSVKIVFNQFLYLVTELCKSFDRALNHRLYLWNYVRFIRAVIRVNLQLCIHKQ